MIETQNFALRKLYVTLHSEDKNKPYVHSTNSHANESKVEHVGVICDGCDKNVYGFRYKCVLCSDYDLCSKCENKGLHSKHCMIRIPAPLQWRSRHGKRLAHHVKIRKASRSPAKGEPKECPCKSKVSNDAYNRHCEQATSWIDTCATYLQDFVNISSECPIMGQDKAKASCLTQNHNDSTAGSSTIDNTMPPQDTHIEFLKNIAENISQFLDPLGIDVNVQVKPEKSPENSSETSSEKSQEKSSEKLPEPVKQATKIDEKTNFSTSYSNENIAMNEKSPKEVNETEQEVKNLMQKKENLYPQLNLQQNTPVTLESGSPKSDDWTLLDKDGVQSTSEVATNISAKNVSDEVSIKLIFSFFQSLNFYNTSKLLNF